MSRRTVPTARTIPPLAAALAFLAAAPTALATFPGHSGLIAFHSETPDGTQIFTVRPNGHELRQITHVAGDAIRADWSPDGRRIAFEIDTANSAEVAIMNADARASPRCGASASSTAIHRSAPTAGGSSTRSSTRNTAASPA